MIQAQNTKFHLNKFRGSEMKHVDNVDRDSTVVFSVDTPCSLQAYDTLNAKEPQISDADKRTDGREQVIQPII